MRGLASPGWKTYRSTQPNALRKRRTHRGHYNHANRFPVRSKPRHRGKINAKEQTRQKAILTGANRRFHYFRVEESGILSRYCRETEVQGRIDSSACLLKKGPHTRCGPFVFHQSGGGAEIRTLVGAKPHYRFSRPTPSAAWVRLRIGGPSVA